MGRRDASKILKEDCKERRRVKRREENKLRRSKLSEQRQALLTAMTTDERRIFINTERQQKSGLEGRMLKMKETGTLHICIALEFMKHMAQGECQSLAKQIQFLYNDMVHKPNYDIKLDLAPFAEECYFERFAKLFGYKNWRVNFYDAHPHELYGCKKSEGALEVYNGSNGEDADSVKSAAPEKLSKKLSEPHVIVVAAEDAPDIACSDVQPRLPVQTDKADESVSNAPSNGVRSKEGREGARHASQPAGEPEARMDAGDVSGNVGRQGTTVPKAAHPSEAGTPSDSGDQEAISEEEPHPLRQVVERVIVLSPDADEVLTLDDVRDDSVRTVFIIGGLVDKTVKKNVTRTYASIHNFEARKFPKIPAVNPILNINNVANVLMDVKLGQSFEEALTTHIAPRRQNLDLKLSKAERRIGRCVENPILGDSEEMADDTADDDAGAKTVINTDGIASEV